MTNRSARKSDISHELVDAEIPLQYSEPDRYLCVWIDRTPDEPHMPNLGVMRWDLQPDDWWKIWPDLMAHPCTYLFAEHHPNRDGPPKFADWVASWPVGFDWEKRIPPHLHDHVRKTLAELPQAEEIAASDDSANVVRYAAPNGAPRAEQIDPVNESERMWRLLVQALANTLEQERENTARLLSTLALAPDSARTLEALKSSVGKTAQGVPK